jgi:hypothetical protein
VVRVDDRQSTGARRPSDRFGRIRARLHAVAVSQSRAGRKALAKLTSEKTRIDRQISALQTTLGALGRRMHVKGARNRGRRMSAAARKAIGERMKTYWAKRRAKSKKSKTTDSRIIQ